MKTKARKKKPVKVKPEPTKHETVKNETFSFFFSGALYGLVFFKLYLTNYLATIPIKTYLNLYVLGWLISATTGALCLILLKIIREKFFAKDSCFYAFMCFLNLVFALYAYQPSQWARPGLLPYFLALQPIGIVLAMLADKMGPASIKINILYGVMITVGLYWFSKINPGWAGVGDWNIFNYVFFVLIVFLFLFGMPSTSGRLVPEQHKWGILDWNVRKTIILYCVAFFLIAFSINTLFNYDPFHYSFYLGPVADLIGGKSLLANINAQYGVLVFYFLRFFFYFLPLGFVSFSLVLAILTAIQYLLFFFIVRKIFASELLAFFALIVLLIINHLIQFNNGILFPSVGPLRFGHIYVLMALILLRNQYPQKRNLFYFLESLVVGIAFFWSFEACFYIFISYLIFLLYESLSFENGAKFDFRLFLKRIMWIVGCILAIDFFIYLDVLRRTHEGPRWSYYFDFVLNYKNGFGMLELPGIGYWWLFVGVLYFSLFAIIGISMTKNKPLPKNLNVIFLLSVYGILQFTYYFGRAHSNNLFHLSMPTILLVIYWLYFIRLFDPPSVPGIVKKLGYGLSVFFMAFYLQKTTDLTIEKIKFQPTSVSVMLYRTFSLLPAQYHGLDSNSLQVVQLMKKYSGDAKALVYFFGETGLSIEMTSGIVNVYPFSDTIQPTVSPNAMDRINSFKPALKIGDCIYTTNPDDFEKKLFEKLADRFDLQLMETQNGVAVYKITGERKSS